MQYKNTKKLEGNYVMTIFDKYGVLEYLNNHFEILHTQSWQWIIEEIDEFIELRKKEEL